MIRILINKIKSFFSSDVQQPVVEIVHQVEVEQPVQVDVQEQPKPVKPKKTRAKKESWKVKPPAGIKSTSKKK
jgi:hypothetical protein